VAGFTNCQVSNGGNREARKDKQRVAGKEGHKEALKGDQGVRILPTEGGVTC